MPSALVTGSSGFVGGYLTRHLRSLGYEVWGITSSEATPAGFHAVKLDVRDAEGLKDTLRELRPDEVYHLAGIAQPSLGLTSEFYDVNLQGTLNVLEAAREVSPRSKVLFVGSAYAYGAPKHPIDEEEVLRPRSHYGVSKAAADMLAYAYACQGLHVVRARPFNHSGPGQRPVYLLPTLVQQFADIAKGKHEAVVRLGNLESVRDFCDVRDMVRAYHLSLQHGKRGEAYNLGSGRGVSVAELFGLMKEALGIEASLITEESRQRPNDLPFLVAKIDKAKRELGWQPKIPLRQTITDMFEALV